MIVSATAIVPTAPAQAAREAVRRHLRKPGHKPASRGADLARVELAAEGLIAAPVAVAAARRRCRCLSLRRFRPSRGPIMTPSAAR